MSITRRYVHFDGARVVKVAGEHALRKRNIAITLLRLVLQTENAGHCTISAKYIQQVSAGDGVIERCRHALFELLQPRCEITATRPLTPFVENFAHAYSFIVDQLQKEFDYEFAEWLHGMNASGPSGGQFGT